MPTICANCGGAIGMRRFLGSNLCSACDARLKAERATALAEYHQLTAAAGDPRTDPAAIGANLPSIATRAGLDAQKVRDLNWNALLSAFEKALADEVITVEEENRLAGVAAALALDRNDFELAIGHYEEAVFIARVNDGRLPVLAAPPIMLKRDEVAHLTTSADMMKEVVIREYRGGSQGVSFRIMKGVSYRVGAHRGTMQVIGSRLEVADRGQLVVTSQRAIFTGARRTQEVRLDKLIDMNVYADAIQFHVSNRQNPSLFKVPSGPLIAAAVTAAAQRLVA